MTTITPAKLAHRYDAVLLFDVQDGNPNGDPDAGNLPRIDPETMQGFVTDVCLKRKVRDSIDITQRQRPGQRIYVQHQSAGGKALEELHQEAHTAVGIPKTDAKNPKPEQRDAARQWMCDQFFDIRAFGAVMSTGINAGQVRGPVQVTFARSIDPVVPTEITITRVAKTTAQRAAEAAGTTEIGRKNVIPYGLYRAHIFVNPFLADQTGFTSEDLKALWQALHHMWDNDRSAARGLMATRALIIFEHEDRLGNAPAHELFERVRIVRKDRDRPARSYADYEVTVDEAGLPAGITVVHPRWEPVG